MLKVKFPLTCVTTGGKMAFCYGLQESLRLEHNLEGARIRKAEEDFGNEIITRVEYDAAVTRWETYKTTYFADSEAAITAGILEWRAKAKTAPFWSASLTSGLVEEK